MNEPIFAEFHKGKKVYSGQVIISSFPDPIDSNPVVDFIGTGELKENYYERTVLSRPYQSLLESRLDFYASDRIIVSAAALVSCLEHIKIKAFVNLLTVPEAYRGSA